MEITKAATNTWEETSKTLDHSSSQHFRTEKILSVKLCYQERYFSHLKMDRVGGHTLNNFKTYGKVKW